MSIELPGWLTEPLNFIGMTWPEADEDLLNAAGDTWSRLASDLESVAQSALNAVQPVMSETQGDAAEAFDRWWKGEEGPEQRLGDDSDAARLLGSTLTGFAALTVTLKLAYIAQLAILAAQIASAIAGAFVTFGATTAAVPGFVAASRAICQAALRKLLTNITGVIKGILERAKGLFRKVARRKGDDVARRADDVVSGARTRPRPDDWEAEERWARQRYDEIRADGGDVDAITDNLPPGSDLTRRDIEQIKQHVFEDEHLLDRYGDATRGRFDPDADIADAWQRLRNGNAGPDDMTLLRHELAESTYVRNNPGVGYSEAHAHANGVANWQQTRGR